MIKNINTMNISITIIKKLVINISTVITTNTVIVTSTGVIAVMCILKSIIVMYKHTY